MISYGFIGLMAGLTSATLVAGLGQGSFLALILFLFAPLPIFIVSLGWQHRAGMVAIISGALLLLAVANIESALVFVIGTGLPAWILSFITLLADQDSEGKIKWYPLGHVLQACALMAAFVFVVTGLITLGGIDSILKHCRDVAELFVRLQTNTPPSATIPTMNGIAPEVMVHNIAKAVPFIAAQGFTLLYVFYLWCAARIVSVSGRLVRPWPVLCEVAMSRQALLVLGLAGIAAFLTTGLPALIALTLTGALGMAFALQGLSFIHDVTKGRSYRGFLLAGVYLVLLATQGIAFFILFLAGITGTFLNIRGMRETNRQSPKDFRQS
jgi:hypothetical protein